MRKIVLILSILSILIPFIAFAEEGGDSPAESGADSPAKEIKPNPITDMDVLSNPGFTSFKTTEARTLDIYTNTQIDFDILVDADIADMSNIFLILSVYDVDTKAPIPEVDKVYLNDKYLGDLTGNNDSWSFTTFPIKKEMINGMVEDRPGVNHVKITVDQLESTNFWMLCDWGAIKANVGFQVVSIYPKGRTYQDESSEVIIKFNEEIKESSLEENIKVTYVDFNELKEVRGKVYYNYEEKAAIFTCLDSLTYGVEYTVKVSKGIQSSSGTQLRNSRSSSFVPLPALKRK